MGPSRQVELAFDPKKVTRYKAEDWSRYSRHYKELPKKSPPKMSQF